MFKVNFEMESADLQKALSVADHAISSISTSDVMNHASQQASVEHHNDKETINQIVDAIKQFAAPFLPGIIKLFENKVGLIRIPKISEIEKVLAKIQNDLAKEQEKNAKLREANQILLEKLDEYENAEKAEGDSDTDKEQEPKAGQPADN